MSVKIPPGVFDILPKNTQEPWLSSYIWEYVENVIRKTAKSFGYHEIRTPIFERTELFQRSIGDATDIVTKEMYTFQDKGERMMTLRPEGTAPVMRSFIENHLNHEGGIQKLFYIAPMFRYERQQAGRYRQHHQFGAEAIGVKKPELDVEAIDLLLTVYKNLGLTNLKLTINSIGDKGSREAYKTALKEFLNKHLENLSPESKIRYNTNPLRILDSKDLNDQKILIDAPTILDYLSNSSREHFESVKGLLSELGIPFELNTQLVRGLDYYNETVFEIIASELGSQNSIGGGGRYDGLLKSLNGPDLPAIGFGTGLERIIQTMLGQGIEISNSNVPTLYLIPMGDLASKECFTLQHDLRGNGISCLMDYSGRKVGKMMQTADQLGATFIAVIGDEELSSGTIKLKRMKTGEELVAPLKHLGRILEVEAKSQAFINIWQEMNKPFEHPSEAEFFYQKISHSIHDTKKVTGELHKAIDIMKELF